jgi:hypothetical protein
MVGSMDAIALQSTSRFATLQDASAGDEAVFPAMMLYVGHRTLQMEF